MLSVSANSEIFWVSQLWRMPTPDSLSRGAEDAAAAAATARLSSGKMARYWVMMSKTCTRQLSISLFNCANHTFD
jgi:hypothetical protein